MSFVIDRISPFASGWAIDRILFRHIVWPIQTCCRHSARHAWCAKPSTTRSGATTWWLRSQAAHVSSTSTDTLYTRWTARKRSEDRGARAFRWGLPKRRCWSSTTTCQRRTAPSPTLILRARSKCLFRRERQAIRPRILQRIRQATGHLPCRRTGTGFHASGHRDLARWLTKMKRSPGPADREHHAKGYKHSTHATALEDGSEYAETAQSKTAQQADKK